MKPLKQIMILGVMIGAFAAGARAGDTSLAVGSQMRAAILLFQDQKADFLAHQRDQQKSNARKLRGEVREQIVAAQASIASASGPLRQEVRESIEDAKHHAKEQSRKLVQETAEAARDSRRGL